MSWSGVFVLVVAVGAQDWGQPQPPGANWHHHPQGGPSWHAPSHGFQPPPGAQPFQPPSLAARDAGFPDIDAVIEQALRQLSGDGGELGADQIKRKLSESLHASLGSHFAAPNQPPPQYAQPGSYQHFPQYPQYPQYPYAQPPPPYQYPYPQYPYQYQPPSPYPSYPQPQYQYPAHQYPPVHGQWPGQASRNDVPHQFGARQDAQYPPQAASVPDPRGYPSPFSPPPVHQHQHQHQHEQPQQPTNPRAEHQHSHGSRREARVRTHKQKAEPEVPIKDVEQAALGAVEDAVKRAMGDDETLKQRIAEAMKKGGGIEGAFKAVMGGLGESGGGLSSIVEESIKSLSKDKTVGHIIKESIDSKGMDNVMAEAIESIGGSEGMMKKAMEQLKNIDIQTLVKQGMGASLSSVQGTQNATTNKTVDMQEFIATAMKMIGNNTNNLGGDDKVQDVVAKAMGQIMGTQNDKIRDVLVKTLGSGEKLEGMMSKVMASATKGDMNGMVTSLLSEISKTGQLEPLIKDVLGTINTDGQLGSVMQTAMKDMLKDKLPGGVDGPMGKIMDQMTKNLASNPDAIAKMVSQSLSSGEGERKLDVASLVTNALAGKLGNFGQVGESDTKEHGATQKLVQDYLKKALDNSATDPLNNLGQDVIRMAKTVMEENNLEPGQFSDLVGQALDGGQVQSMIEATMREQMASGAIDSMIEQTIQSEFPFIPIEVVKPIMTEMLNAQLKNGGLQNIMGQFLKDQVRSAATGATGPSVASLQAKIMEELSKTLPQFETPTNNEKSATHSEL
eukprot:c19758_g1_i1.p1 GENE.c19758_g1_i1~~c19758_g1_i1.p1  ORF type:complete len:787 (+),score=156.94 c19758_g1_i1:45-2405(+)